MTAEFDRLQTGPQTDVNIGQLAPEERVLVRKIQINGTSGATKQTSVGQFIPVFYLMGEKKRAAERFVELNRAELSQLDFSTRNLISTSVDREIYDWILHALGERELTKYETVVVERRSDGTTWCIGRLTFEEAPMRRYSSAESASARIDNLSLETLYDDCDEIITVSALREHPAVRGDCREVLDVFRQSPTFDCVPTTVDGELAIRKI